MFELDLHIIKTNILIQFQHAQAKNAVSSVNKISLQVDLVTEFLTRYDPFRTWPRYHLEIR